MDVVITFTRIQGIECYVYESVGKWKIENMEQHRKIKEYVVAVLKLVEPSTVVLSPFPSTVE